MVPSTQAATPQMGGGMNQMLEIFKMQYLMKFLESSGAGGRSSLLTMVVLMGYDQFIKYVPMLVQMFYTWIQVVIYGKQDTSSLSKHEPPLLTQTPQPPKQKQIRAYIQFERQPDMKVADPRIDAVIHHVCNLPEVTSLRYNGIEMIPNFKDMLMIENDVWFEILHSSGGGGITISQSSGAKVEPILYRLSTYDHDITWLHKFVEQAMDTFEQEKRNKLGSETYYFDHMTVSSSTVQHPIGSRSCLFTKSKFTSNRTLSNVYLAQIDDLRNRVEFFMRRRDWYDSKGIPHTLGIVMYGEPGCGKTSTIKAIANETKRHIFNIQLSEIKSKEMLKDLFYNDQVFVLHEGKRETLNIPLKQRLYVIEDIDAMNSVVLKRSATQIEEDKQRQIKIQAEVEHLKQTQGEAMAKAMMQGKQSDESDTLDLATLLNVLDGVRETPGRVIILSTNYPERLDEALVRPGRFDILLEFEKHTCAVLQQHIEKHYDCKLTDKQIAQIHQPALHKKWTPAEVSQILFRRIGSVDDAIRDLVHENPEQVFKFSRGNVKQPPQEQTHEQPPEEGTLLTELVGETEPIEQMNITDIASPTIATNVIVSTTTNVLPEDDEDDDSFFGKFSGGGGGYVDRPSKEQQEQEEGVRKQLFGSELIGVAKINEHYVSKIKIAERAFIQNHGEAAFHDWKVEKPEIRVIEKERSAAIHAERLRQMGQSSLFKPLEECPVTNPTPTMPTYNPTIQSLLETEEANIQAVRSATIDEVLQSPMFQMDGPGAANDEIFVPFEFVSGI
jgi:DNA polymerase III delta prime subunit